MSRHFIYLKFNIGSTHLNIVPGKNKLIWGKATKIAIRTRKAPQKGSTPLKISYMGTSLAIADISYGGLPEANLASAYLFLVKGE